MSTPEHPKTPQQAPRGGWRLSVGWVGLIASLLWVAEPAQAQIQAQIQAPTQTRPQAPAPVPAPLRVLPKTLGSEVSMPFVQGGPAGQAARINQAIWIDTLARPAPAQRSDAVTLSENEQRTTPSASFKVLRHDARVLSLQLDLEGCGAYCESYQRPFAFDRRDGRWLTASDLFTTEGLTVLQTRIAAQRAALIQQQIRRLKQTLTTAQKAKRRPQEGDEDALLMYQDCLRHWLPGAHTAYRDLRNERLAISPQHLTFSAGRCSNHAMRALDEVGDFHNRLPISSLRTQLSPYGRAVLLGEAPRGARADTDTSVSTRPASGLLNQVLRGSLDDGKLPITMRLTRSPATATASDSAGQARVPVPVEGTYFYDRMRQLIPLRGTLQGDQLTLTEGDNNNSSDAKAPVFQLTVTPQALRGTWRQGERSLPVEITP